MFLANKKRSRVKIKNEKKNREKGKRQKPWEIGKVKNPHELSFIF